METGISSAERDCILKLAAIYWSGNPEYLWKDDPHVLGLTADNYHVILGLMESYGAIDGAEHAAGQPYFIFRVTPKAVQLARRIEEKEAEPPKRKNVVEDLKYTLQCHPVAGWLLIAFTAITLAATAITQIGGALKMIGLIK